MRTLPLAALLVLAACGDPDQEALAVTSDDGRIECAVDGTQAFSRVCAVERTTGGEGVILTLRHPSGGFRRFLVTSDGRGVVAADGAMPAAVSVIAGDRIEVAVAGDRYRLPATVKGR